MSTALIDKYVIDQIVELYGANPQFDDLLWPEADKGVCVALRRTMDTDLILCRGSVTPQDWVRDFMAFPLPSVSHPQLGMVHPGFLLGLDATYAKMKPLLRAGAKTIIGGHSLGAGHGSLLGGLFVADDLGIDLTFVLFGEPRSGTQGLRDLLSGKPYRSYRNAGSGGHDLVTDVPTSPPYSRNRTLIDVSAPPPSGDSWGLLSWHHSQLYAEALAPPALQP